MHFVNRYEEIIIFISRLPIETRSTLANDLLPHSSAWWEAKEEAAGRVLLIKTGLLYHAVTPDPCRYTVWSSPYYSGVSSLRWLLSSKSTLMKCAFPSGRLKFNVIINLLSTTVLLPFVVLNLSDGTTDDLLPYWGHMTTQTAQWCLLKEHQL